MATTKIDNTIYSDARDKGALLKQMYSQRDNDFDVYNKMYLLNWDDQPSGDGVMVTISPDARNRLLGAKRLLTSTVPKASVTDKDIEKKDQIEQACQKIIYQSGRSARMPLHYSAVEAALLYGEIHMAINDTALMAAKASKRNKMRAEQLAKLTPFLIEVWNPRYGYPEFDAYGLSGYMRQVQVMIGELAARFGQVGEDYALGKNPTTKETLNIYYDVENYAAWIGNTPMIAEPHGLPFIPVSCTLVDGSSLFDKPEEQRQPLLYGYSKSKLWERQNLSMTVMYSNIFNVGINPTFVHTAPQGNPDKKMTWDGSTPGGVIDLEYGEAFSPMVTKGIIDPSFNQGLEIAERKGEESTLYSQALGQPMQGSPAYSTVSLLSQSGRLPLIATQKMAEVAFGSALEMCMTWYKQNGDSLKDWPVKPSDLPETLQIECKIDIDLPQDKLQMANVSGMLLEKGITDREWVRKNIMNIEENQTMDEAVATDRMFEAMVTAYMQSAIPQMVQELSAQTAQQPGMQPPMAPQENVPQGLGAAQMQPPDMAQMGQGFDTGQGGMPAAMAGQMPMQGPIDQQIPAGMGA
jgi:hypothetical protein